MAKEAEKPERFCSWQREISPNTGKYKCPHFPTLDSCPCVIEIKYGKGFSKDNCEDFIPIQELSPGLTERLSQDNSANPET